MKGKIEKFEGEKYELAVSYTIKYYDKYGLMTPLYIHEEDMAEFMDDINKRWKEIKKRKGKEER